MKYSKGDKVWFVDGPLLGKEAEVTSNAMDGQTNVEVKIGNFVIWTKVETVQKPVVTEPPSTVPCAKCAPYVIEKLALRDRHIDALQVQLKELQEPRVPCPKCAAFVKGQTSALEAQVKRLQGELRTAMSNIPGTTQYRDALMESCKSRDIHIEDLQKRLSGAESQANKFRQACATREAEINSMDKEIANLRKQLQTALEKPCSAICKEARECENSKHEAVLCIDKTQNHLWEGAITFPRTLWGFSCSEQKSIPDVLRNLANAYEAHATVYYSDRATGRT